MKSGLRAAFATGGLLLSLLGATQAHAAWTPIALWRFSEKTGVVANDAIGDHDGTIGGGVTLGRVGPPGKGSSYGFGGNGRVVIGNMGTLSPYSQWVEVSIRIKTTSLPPPTRDFNLFRSGAFETTYGFKVELLSNGRASCAFKGTAGHDNNVTGGAMLADNNWHFIQCFLRHPAGGLDEIVLAVDGVIVARETKPIGSVALTLDGIVGHYSSTAVTGGYIGQADEPRIRVCQSGCNLPSS